jgi:hypothetical protein
VTPGRFLRPRPLGPGPRAGAILLAVAVSLAAGPATADQWTARTGIHVDAWSADRPSGYGDGSQVLVPLGLWYDTPRWGFAVRGSYGTTQREPSGLSSDPVTGFTDTTASGYYRLRVRGTEIRLGLDLDLPTGVSRLKGRQLPAVQDEDLVALQRLGEGLDVNPTIIVYRHFGDWGLGGGLGYLWTGEYDPTRGVGNDDFDPGDELTVSVLGDVFLGDVWRLIGRVAYTRYTEDERGGVKVFRHGDEIDLGVTLEWRPEPWWATITVRDIVRQKAERLNAAGQLVDELETSFGNEVRASVTVGYILDETWTFRGTVDVRYVAANGYGTGDPLHDGGRFKIAVGPGVTWSLGRTLAVDGSVRYFYLDGEPSPIFPRGATIHGVHADVRLTYRF